MFRPSNYGGNETCIEDEWNHVFEPDSAPRLRKGTDHTGRNLGLRKKVPWQHFRDNMLALIQASFAQIGWTQKAHALKQSDLAALGLLDAEIIALRLYTGPAFMLYNTTLRAMANPGPAAGIVPGWDPNFAGQDVRGRFVTTLHTINHGIIKLSQLSVAIDVHRGLAGMRLPESFLQEDVDGVRAGVEVGFMSTTANRDVALEYTKG